MARLTISCIVRRFCLDCQGNSSQAVRECADEGCALWEHRLPHQGATPQAASLPEEKVADNADAAPATVPPSPSDAGCGDATGARLVASPKSALGKECGKADAAHASPSGMESTGALSAMGSADALGAIGTTGVLGTSSTGLGARADAKAREAARRIILRAVRRHCMTCAACRADVRTCAARECGLWSYRFGVNPETYRAVRQRFARPKALSLF